MLELIASLVFIAPLAATMVIGLGIMTNYFQHESAEPAAARLSTSAALIALLSVVGLLIFSLLKPGQLPASLTLLDWFSSGQLNIKIAMALDYLALGIGSLFALFGELPAS